MADIKVHRRPRVIGTDPTPVPPPNTGGGTVTPPPVIDPSLPTATGTTYYFDPGSTAIGNVGTQANPFKLVSTLQAAINGGTIKSGDQVLFNKGTTTTGKLDFSGKVYTDYLILGAYGAGSNPVIKHDLSGTSTGRSIITGNSTKVFISNLDFTDPAMSDTDHTIVANVAYGAEITGGAQWWFHNCNFSKLGCGISIGASNSKITYCSVQNGRMIRSDSTLDNDYGANGIIVEANSITVDHCLLKDLWAVSMDYGYDGGAVEVFGSYSNLTVTKCTVINCNGFQEFGASDGGNSSNHLIAYNLLINNGKLAYINNSGQFSVHVSNYQFFNNTVIETILQRTMESTLFGQAVSTTTANILNLRNNIFYIGTTAKLIGASLNSSAQVTHENNGYRMAALTQAVFSLHASELYVGANAVFVSEAGDPTTWNYQLPYGSTLVDKGMGLTNIPGMPAKDFFGNPVNGPYPDMGMSEYQYQ